MTTRPPQPVSIRRRFRRGDEDWLELSNGTKLPERDFRPSARPTPETTSAIESAGPQPQTIEDLPQGFGPSARPIPSPTPPIDQGRPRPAFFETGIPGVLTGAASQTRAHVQSAYTGKNLQFQPRSTSQAIGSFLAAGTIAPGQVQYDPNAGAGRDFFQSLSGVPAFAAASPFYGQAMNEWGKIGMVAPSVMKGAAATVAKAADAVTPVKRLAKGFAARIPNVSLPPQQITPDPQVFSPSRLAQDVIGMKPVTARLSMAERAGNIVRGNPTIRQLFKDMKISPDHPIATPIMKEYARAKPRIESLATELSQRIGAQAGNVFTFDKRGRITNLAGLDDLYPNGPTMSGLAARLPSYQAHLTAGQLTFLQKLQKELEPFAMAWKEARPDIGTRADIMEGGFYIPRGDAAVIGAEDLPKIYAVRGRSGAAIPGAAKHAHYLSMEEAFALGQDYVNLEEALYGYVIGVGRDVTKKFVKDSLLEARGLNGEILAKRLTLADDHPIRIAADIASRKRQSAEDAIAHIQSARRGEELPAGTVKAIENLYPEVKGRLSPATKYTLEQLIAAGSKAAEPPKVLTVPKPGPLILLQKKIGKVAALLRAGAPVLDDAGELLTPAQAEKYLRQLKGDLGFSKFRIAMSLAIKEAGEVTPAIQARLGRMTFVAKQGDVEAHFLNPAVPAKVLRSIGDQDKALQELLTEIRGTPYVADKTAKGNPVTRYKDGLVERFRQAEDDAISARSRALEDSKSMGLEEKGVRGTTELDIGYSFPDEMVNAVEKILNAEKAAEGDAAGLSTKARAINGIQRGLRTTHDISGIGIQILVGGADKSKAFGGAVETSLRALVDRKVFGSFLEDFNMRALRSGALSAGDWAKANLRIGGVEQEATLGGVKQAGKRIAEQIERIPGVRQSNRAYGVVTDTMRLNWADELLKEQLRPGWWGLRRARSLQDIIASGDDLRIAAIVNKGTGWTAHRAGGDFGELVLFAPRFFQARIETVVAAARSLRPGATLDERIARRTLSRYIGGAALLTYMANKAQGEETDFRPLVKDQYDGDMKYNPNFMRIRFGGRDWSLMGPYDSLARMMMGGIGDQDLTVLRGSLSPILTSATDLLTNESFNGNKTRSDNENFLKSLFSPETGEYLAKSSTPFSWQNVKSNVEQGPVEGPLNQLGDLMGIKGSPLSRTDDLNDLLSESLLDAEGNPTTPENAVQSMDELELAGRTKFMRMPEAKAVAARHTREVDSNSLSAVYGALGDKRYAQQEARDKDLSTGKLSPEDWRRKQADSTAELRGASEFRQLVKASREKKNKTANDEALIAYYKIGDRLTDKRTGLLDIDAYTETTDAYLESIPKSQADYIIRNLHNNATALEHQFYDFKRTLNVSKWRDAPAWAESNLDWFVKLSPGWKRDYAAMKNAPGGESRWREDYLRNGGSQAKLDELTNINTAVEIARRKWIGTQPALDVGLALFYDANPQSPQAKAEKAKRLQEQYRQERVANPTAKPHELDVLTDKNGEPPPYTVIAGIYNSLRPEVERTGQSYLQVLARGRSTSAKTQWLIQQAKAVIEELAAER